MTLFLALAVAASSPDPMTNWASCMSAYAQPRLKAQSVERIVDGGFAACSRQEAAARQSYVQQFGAQKGVDVFVGVKFNVRKIMLNRVTQAKQLAGRQEP